MNKILRLFYKILPKGTLIEHLGKEFVHLALDYKKAQATIDDAMKQFEKTRDLTTKDFESKKAATLARTEKYIGKLEDAVENEEIELDLKYAKAKEKNRVKKDSVTDLLGMLERVGSESFPLH